MANKLEMIAIEINVCECNASDFVSQCWEAHPASKFDLQNYFEKMLKDGRGVLFAAHDTNGEYLGRVALELHPGYSTRGRPCVTFGWLDGCIPEVISALLHHSCEWARCQEVENGSKKSRNNQLRGPLSFPKNIGGIGCQTEGFDLFRMYGVSTNRCELAEWIELAGFKKDSPYACMNGTPSHEWKSAKLPAGYHIEYWELDEWRNREEEILNAAQVSFGGILPDSTTGLERLREMVETQSFHPLGRYLNAIAIAPNRDIAGALLCVPNLFQLWDHHPVTQVNCDTAFIVSGHQGIGLLSALNNAIRANAMKHLGINYVEGTTIWFANENAVKIFPHGEICRKHIVFQKHLKISN